MTLPTKTEHRAIVDTHRHPWGQKMQSKIEERGLLDPKQGFPQTNALDLMAYREVSIWTTPCLSNARAASPSAS